jgi:hypothetical protein
MHEAKLDARTIARVPDGDELLAFAPPVLPVCPCLEVEPLCVALVPPLLGGGGLGVVDVAAALAPASVAACAFLADEPPHDERPPALRSSTSDAPHAGARRLRLHCVIELPSILGLTALPVLLRRGWPLHTIVNAPALDAG